MPQYESADIQAQQAQELKLENLKKHEIRERKNLIEVAIQKIEIQWFKDFSKNMSDDDVRELKKKYADLLQMLTLLEEQIATHDSKLAGDKSLSEQMKKLEGEEIAKELYTTIEAAREKMTKILEDADNTFNDIDDGIQKLAVAEFNEKEVAEVFKQPIYSVKDIFEEEVERNLLMGADARMVIDPNITKLKKEASEIKAIYYKHRHYLNDSDDWHDDQRFLGRIDNLLNSNGANQSLDVANFIMDSRKFISSLKRRIRFEKSSGNTNKRDLMTLLKNSFGFNFDLSNLDKITDGDLTVQAQEFLDNNPVKTTDENIQRMENENIEIPSKKKQIAELEQKRDELQKQINDEQILNDSRRATVNSYDIKITQLTASIKHYSSQEIKDMRTRRDNLGEVRRLLNNLNATTGVTESKDIAQLNDSYEDINKIVSDIKINGEKGIEDVKKDIVSKYSELDVRQKTFAYRLVDDSNFNMEERDKMAKKVEESRQDLQKEMLENWVNANRAIKEKIQNYEGLISEFLDELMNKDPETKKLYDNVKKDNSFKNIRAFQNHPKVERLRQLHQQFGAFQNAEKEKQYIEFMYVGNKDMLETSKAVANFHSLNQSRILQNAFGYGEEDYSDFRSVQITRGVLNGMAELKKKDARGFPGFVRKTLEGFGDLGYSATKVAVNYPTRWGAVASRGIVDWTTNKSTSWNILVRGSTNFAKLLSKPAYLVFKPAELILNWIADTVGGELKGGTVTNGHLDNLVKAKMKNICDNQIETLFDSVVALITHGLAIPSEAIDDKFLSTKEKRRNTVRWLNRMGLRKGRMSLRRLFKSHQALSCWHGAY